MSEYDYINHVKKRSNKNRYNEFYWHCQLFNQDIIRFDGEVQYPADKYEEQLRRN